MSRRSIDSITLAASSFAALPQANRKASSEAASCDVMPEGAFPAIERLAAKRGKGLYWVLCRR